MRFRHLVFHEVLAPARVELGEPHVVHVHVRGLHPVPERMRRVLVPVPGVVRPVPAPLRLLRLDFPDIRVQQGPAAPVHPRNPHFSDDAQNGHPGPEFKAARRRPLGHFDHFRRIALLPHPTGARFPAIPLRDDDHRFGQVRKRRIPAHPQHVIQVPRVKLIFRHHIRREFRTAVIHPGLPAPPHQRPFQPIRAIHPPMHRIPLQAHPGIMRKRPPVAIQVLIRLMVVILLHPHDHPVAHKRPNPTRMRIVRRTTPRKRTVIPVLIVIHPLPRAIRVFPQGVAHFNHRLQRRQRQRLIR